ncbi:hypothetical protein KVR01_004496 [Diaporthe batatas]|uniref:uncharacterized protein n=1 Tax=Diaporthe batatas TaxID=748121 RepID=UPI001D0372E0|nr:uncharacterized protein KVR01_004496 [Diaporthe batatas]KAG8165944.1 hypothetical protein KVR01_004496 [Diaporthe batatas]
MKPNKTEQNTALHLAARHENLDMLRAVYRLFCRGWLPGYESFGREPEEDATDRLDEEEFGPPLVFLRTQNAAGRDAAAEARAVGREDNARWCDEVLGRLDPEGKCRTRGAMRKITEYVHYIQGMDTNRGRLHMWKSSRYNATGSAAFTYVNMSMRDRGFGPWVGDAAACATFRSQVKASI